MFGSPELQVQLLISLRLSDLKKEQRTINELMNCFDEDDPEIRVQLRSRYDPEIEMFS